MRIGRLLSQLGLCSRREAHDFIRQHRVQHLEKQVTEINYRIDYDDTGILLYVDDKEHLWVPVYDVLLLNKPRGVTCSHRAFKKQKTIFSLLPAEFSSYFFAGRLDQDSRGLVVLSNDGDLIYDLTHPSKQVEKVYMARTSRPLNHAEIERSLKGIYDKEEKLRFSSIKPVKPGLYRVTLHHGKNREIRRLLTRLGVKVLDLERIKLGPYELQNLPEGKFRQV